MGLLLALLVLVSIVEGLYYYSGAFTDLPGVSSKSPKVELVKPPRNLISITLPGFTSSYMTLEGITYDGEPMGRSLSDEDLGPKFAEVKDLATSKLVPVYAVEGYDTEEVKWLQ